MASKMVWQCRDRALSYGENVLVMGIVNITPDSFSDGGDFFDPSAAAARVREFAAMGVDIVDLGGQSTRPGAVPVTPEAEWLRLKGVLERLQGFEGAVLSVDTYFPEVAETALQNGVHIINDVSGKVNPKMAAVVQKYGAGWIIMHSTGEKENIIEDVRAFFARAASQAQALGVKKECLCFDMGIGFGKTREEDLALIANVPAYKPAGYPLLFAASRKRVIGYASGEPEPKKRTPGNIAADTAAILGGADMVRLHDPAGQMAGVRMAGEIRKRVQRR